MEVYYIIEYFNCKKGFQKDSIEFEGPDAFKDAIQWGRNNFNNFHQHMIKVVYLDHHLSSSNSNK
jgi:hypothetical protein